MPYAHRQGHNSPAAEQDARYRQVLCVVLHKDRTSTNPVIVYRLPALGCRKDIVDCFFIQLFSQRATTMAGYGK